MKKIITTLFAAVLCCAANADSKKIPKYTASYYKMYIDKFLGKEVKLYIRNFYIGSSYHGKKGEFISGHKTGYAYTHYRDDYGGSIKISIPEDLFIKTVEKYGSDDDYIGYGKYRTKALTGILHKEDSTLWIELKNADNTYSSKGVKTMKKATSKEQDMDTLATIVATLSESKRKRLIAYAQRLKNN